ncbi:FdtA/QdtA family cupin domain-containing protein [Lysinibacillus sp. Ag94]|uniref:sugar 3,4-ketoisomerase n=1 Tax=Lysinibacillus sp. Ag94 TaxID=2936682 RepID=UPI00200F199C|nr:FdtA/QdtA family cupin domain-containing protein [Lysinibacillus sp. Ag94]UPW83766.1 FdtA/QdtA family cupin domain-containing protein [Lysinibacillus sp. Ag94]
MNNCLVELKDISDERGSLVVIENLKEIPFEVKRVYYLYNLRDDKARGFHAHKTLNQAFLCLNGSCKVLLDDGKNQTIYEMNASNQMLLCKNRVWHKMFGFSDNCIFLVLADQEYQEDDYIRNYQDFVETVKDEKYD